jgi:hypothetical protein
MSVTIQIRYKPHNGQSEFHESRARFRILACGRRWGKTKGGANEAIRLAVQSGSDSVGFCVAPTYWHTQKQWREFLLYCPPEIITNINRADRLITLLGQRLIWFKSADNPDSLRSEGLDWLWVDEGAQIKEEAWDLALRPALMDKKGKAIFTGTPKGHNWYWRLWLRGQDPLQTDYKSWNYSSQNNPYLDPKEIEDFARDMPKRAYQQEILGKFLKDVGSVFRNVRSHIKKIPLGSQKGHRYVVGCDVAKHQDFTVLIAVDVASGQLHGFDRFGELDWVLQTKRIVNFCQQYNNARLLIDSTGVGDPIYDRLRREGVRVDGYKFTLSTKADLIDNLSLIMDNNEICYPEILELINELELFGFKMGATGTTHYGAPEGYHDDCVISLALAVWQLKKPPIAWKSGPVRTAWSR